MTGIPPHPLTAPGIGTPEEQEYWRRVDAAVRERIEGLGPIQWVYWCSECSRAFSVEAAQRNDHDCPGCGLAVPRYRVER